MAAEKIVEQASVLSESAKSLATDAEALVAQVSRLNLQTGSGGTDVFVFYFTIFVLACFVGYYVVWSVAPALHSTLMSVTNAISSVIIVGALIAAGPLDMSFSKVFGFLAVVLASVNIFGGFIVSQRMLSMFKTKK